MMKMMMMMMMMMIVTINNIVGVFFGTYRRGLDDPEPVAARPPPPGLDALVGLAGLGLALVGHNKRWERRLAATQEMHGCINGHIATQPTAQKTNQLPHKQQHKKRTQLPQSSNSTKNEPIATQATSQKMNPIATINQQRTIKQQQ
jgi:hypothetical protein